MSEKKYDDNNRGIISKNDRKEEPNHADQTGSCKIEGVEYWVNGWIKERNDGSGKFLSLSFKPKVPKAKTPSETYVEEVGDDPDGFNF